MARRPKPWFRKERKSWFVTIAGVRHNLGPDKAAAFELFYRLMRQPAPNKVDSRSFAAIADAFLEWTGRNRAPDTYEWYLDHLQSFLNACPTISIDQLRPYHVEQWASEADRSVNTRRNKMRAVKRCLKWARTQGYIDENPIENLVIPSAEGREVYISSVQFEELLSHVRSEAFGDLLRVTYQVGCRPQESLRVEARHVDLANSRWVFPKSESKGKRAPRIVYLTDFALRVTRDLVERYPAGKLFRNQNGKAWTPDSVGCQFSALQQRMGKQRMAELGVVVTEADISYFVPGLATHRTHRGERIPKTKAELRGEAKRKLTALTAKSYAPRYSLYALRHSWATNALQTEGLDALTVAVLMGHRDPSTLAKTYQHLSHSPEHLLKQARRAAG